MLCASLSLANMQSMSEKKHPDLAHFLKNRQLSLFLNSPKRRENQSLLLVVLKVPRTHKGDFPRASSKILWSLFWVELCPSRRIYRSPNSQCPNM